MEGDIAKLAGKRDDFYQGGWQLGQAWVSGVQEALDNVQFRIPRIPTPSLGSIGSPSVPSSPLPLPSRPNIGQPLPIKIPPGANFTTPPRSAPPGGSRDPWGANPVTAANITIVQQPGEDAERLADRVVAKIDARNRLTRASGRG